MVKRVCTPLQAQSKASRHKSDAVPLFDLLLKVWQIDPCFRKQQVAGQQQQFVGDDTSSKLSATLTVPSTACRADRFSSLPMLSAIAFFNKVAEVAEAEGHHPDLKLHNYRDVEITVSTHAAGALTFPDFVLASKLDALDVDYSPKWLQQYREKAASRTAQ